MSQADTKMDPIPDNKGRTIALWGLQIIAAVMFLGSGGAKLASAQPTIEVFEKIGIGHWFRYLTGILEVGGAVGLFLPRYSFYAACLLAIVMVGAIVTHVAIIGGSPAPAIFLLLVTGAIAYLKKP